MLDQIYRLLVVVYVYVLRVYVLEGELDVCIYVTFCSCMIHLFREGKGKGEPITGHEAPEGE